MSKFRILDELGAELKATKQRLEGAIHDIEQLQRALLETDEGRRVFDLATQVRDEPDEAKAQELWKTLEKKIFHVDRFDDDPCTNARNNSRKSDQAGLT